MTSWRLDTAKLAKDIDDRRGQASYREVARQVGVNPDVLSRLNAGLCPSVDALLSLLMWVNPQARAADYALAGDRRSAPAPVPRRRWIAPVPERANP